CRAAQAAILAPTIRLVIITRGAWIVAVTIAPIKPRIAAPAFIAAPDFAVRAAAPPHSPRIKPTDARATALSPPPRSTTAPHRPRTRDTRATRRPANGPSTIDQAMN